MGRRFPGFGRATNDARDHHAWLLLAVLLSLSVPPSISQPDHESGTLAPWIVATDVGTDGYMEVSLEVTQPPVYGQVVNAVIEVSNATDRDREVVVSAQLGEVAHFVDGQFGVFVEDPDQVVRERGLKWPPLLLPAGAKGQLPFTILITWDARGDLYLEAQAYDTAFDQSVISGHLHRTTQLPDGDGSLRFLSMATFVLFMVVPVVLWLIWRSRARPGGFHPARGLALFVAAVLALVGIPRNWLPTPSGRASNAGMIQPIPPGSWCPPTAANRSGSGRWSCG